ncbi:glucose 1,6-bisphosphate synthase [Salmo salar]|uniref:Glucose 1,6-bisphosphate synthase n=1 Tax=Salmo salar TaxID=8030 RepID=A0A1S3SXH9_SALSA|nr:glucose 1,6-bisphosphate synthase [Salmo salar]|eukprot:XP_014069043.1 PREDICTED: glucose 1,6-bisphosphate synthase [Salmo salar]
MENNGDLDLNCHATGDVRLDTAIYQWIKWDKNPKTRAQIEALLLDGQVEELRRRLCSRMTFGTAGLRAAMGAGFALINDLTIIQSTQGMYKYLARSFPDFSSRGIVVGYDTRAQEASGCNSERLARLTAAVMLCKDIPVFLFSTYVPTPFVPYAVKRLGAAAGVMVTASHNPKEDNGYKVYWHNGAQISSPNDKEILKCIEESSEPWSESWNESLADNSPLRSDPLREISKKYMEDLSSVCFHRELNTKSPLKFVHSSFHGVGHDYVQQAFRAFGFPPPIPVPEQKDPDPNFSTVSCPNPEEGESVLELSLRLAERENATIVMATDPDADRLAVAEQSDRCGWKVFTGNELAALLGWWMLFNWKETHSDPADRERMYMLATTVSSKILKAFARIEGFHFEETLPGFKWIGKKIHELAKTGNEVIFAFEESIGFLCGSMVPDKDGVSAAVVVAEMASYLYNKNLTLNQQLENIFEIYGYHISTTSYVICHDPPTVKRIFTRLRNFEGENTYPRSSGGHSIVDVRDVTTGYDSSQPDKLCVLPMTKSSEMITFTLQNGIVATLRTSGTEPKIKFYTEFCARPGKSDISSLEEELKKVTDTLVEEFLEPDKNNLIRRSI